MPNEWQTALDYVKSQLSEMAYSTYFANTNFVSCEGDVVTISVPNPFTKTSIESKYIEILREALSTAGYSFGSINIIIKETAKKKNVVKRAVEVLPYQNVSANFSTNFTPAARPQSTTAPFKPSMPSVSTMNSGLNPVYRLDNYVIGSNNELAVSAARAVISNPGHIYNPLFIYGGPGLGKTHLIQAIGNEFKELHPEMKVIYLTIETFYREFVAAMKQHIDNFSEKYREADVLIIDDFQFIEGKTKSQEEFFHTFNELHQNGKQVILSADRLPSQIGIDQRLSSRLMMGMAIDIQFPDVETRCAIIAAKAEALGKSISDKAIEIIARSVDTNIRELEGRLHQILLMSEMQNKTPEEFLDDDTYSSLQDRSARKAITAKQVVEKVAKYYDVSAKELYGKSRLQNIKNARQVAMYLMSDQLGLSTVKIGKEFGKDHTTIMHGIKKITADLKTDFNLRSQVNELRGKLYGN